MSLLKTLGKIAGGAAKVVGKVALNTGSSIVKTATGGTVDIAAAVSSSQTTATQAAPVAAAPSVSGSVQPIVAKSLNTNTLGGSLTNLFNAAAGLFSGKTHAQVDVNTGVGGRASDQSDNGGILSGLPSWALPAGIAGAVGLLIMSSRKR